MLEHRMKKQHCVVLSWLSHFPWNKPQSHKRDCGLTCSVRKAAVDRRRPLRKAPVDRHARWESPHWMRSGRRGPTRSCSFRTSTSICCHRARRAAAVWYRYMGNLRPAYSIRTLPLWDGDPDIINGLTANDRWHQIYRLQQRSLSLGKGLMLAETVVDTDGQTLGILKYKIVSERL